VTMKAFRKLGLDRNPLRRRADRVEAWLTVVVALAVMAMGPFAVWSAASAAHDSAAAAVQRDKRYRSFQVAAVLRDDPARYLVHGADGVDQQGSVPARWTGPDKSVHSGLVDPPSGARCGGSVVITTDVHGNVVDPPIPPNPVGAAVISGGCAAVVLLAVAAVMVALIRWLTNRSRMSDWQTEWLLVERGWSGRR